MHYNIHFTLFLLLTYYSIFLFLYHMHDFIILYLDNIKRIRNKYIRRLQLIRIRKVNHEFMTRLNKESILLFKSNMLLENIKEKQKKDITEYFDYLDNIIIRELDYIDNEVDKIYDKCRNYKIS